MAAKKLATYFGNQNDVEVECVLKLHLNKDETIRLQVCDAATGQVLVVVKDQPTQTIYKTKVAVQ